MSVIVMVCATGSHIYFESSQWESERETNYLIINSAACLCQVLIDLITLSLSLSLSFPPRTPNLADRNRGQWKRYSPQSNRGDAAILIDRNRAIRTIAP